MKGIGHSPTSILQRKNGVCIYMAYNGKGRKDALSMKF